MYPFMEALTEQCTFVLWRTKQEVKLVKKVAPMDRSESTNALRIDIFSWLVAQVVTTDWVSQGQGVPDGCE